MPVWKQILYTPWVEDLAGQDVIGRTIVRVIIQFVIRDGQTVDTGPGRIGVPIRFDLLVVSGSIDVQSGK